MSARAVTPTAAAPVSVLTPVERPMLQRSCDCGQHTGGSECEECKKKKKMPLQRYTSGSGVLPLSSPVAPAIVHEVLRSSGRSLDPETRTLMEPRFRQDFSQVRVHTDERAAESARAVGAHAYTVGRHVVFGAGRYAPHTTTGRQLLGHELTHVVQQSASPYTNGELVIGETADAAEREAIHLGKADTEAARVECASPPRLQGSWDWERAGLGLLIGEGVGLLAGGIALAAGSPFLALGLLLGGMAAGFLIGGLTGPPDPTKIENPPVCGPPQLKVIAEAMKHGTERVSRAVALFTAYKAAPGNPANKPVHERLLERFHSAGNDTVAKVERVLTQLKTKFNSGLQPECHGGKDLCTTFAAYVPDSQHVVFCPSFFQPGSDAGLALIHEFTHSLVGGASIVDRGYQRERVLKRLSTDEALTNAESYAEFIQDLATGKAVASAAPEDKLKDCPNDWQEPVRDAIAKAERWTTNVLNVFESPSSAAYWGTVAAKHLPNSTPATASKDLVRALQVYRTAHDKFHAAVHFVCQPKGGDPCNKGGSVAWTGSGSDFFICADWKTKKPDDQVVAMLAGLYGYLAGLSDAAWRTGLARIAFEITQSRFGVPSHAAIVGSAAWSPDQISITFRPTVPGSAAKLSYEESGKKHERLSKDVPRYEGPICQASSLPFTFEVTFFVDSVGQERPGPYQPLKAALDYSLDAPGSRLRDSQQDPATAPREPGSNLPTKVGSLVNLKLDKNGPFHIKITLTDPETGTVRIYEDVIEILAVRPCDTPDKEPGGGPGRMRPEIDPRKQKRESRLT